MTRPPTVWVWTLGVIWCAACGDSGTGPAAPSGPSSFLTGTWQGSVTIQVNPDGSGPQPGTTGTMTWTFEVVPQTNLQTFRATIRSVHARLPMTTVATAALLPTNTPPAQISTQGDFSSPRGCRGTFGSFGVAEERRIDADFKGVDCNGATFTGRVALNKQ
jgi:hypothetical protein